MTRLSNQFVSYSSPQLVTLLGATGSVGKSTLDVISRHPALYKVFALSGFSNLHELEKLCLKHHPQYVVVPGEAATEALQKRLCLLGSTTEVLENSTGLEFIAGHAKVDTVVAAIVGAAALTSILAAARSGKKILLANKEALVMSGALFMKTVRDNGAVLLPIDSEHNAITQCLPVGAGDELSMVGVRRLLLTASGGPFLRHALEDLASVTPEQACAHPTWSMGRKISVDSATLMNKGFELIEACWLFNMPASQVEVVIHPQSVVHSLVDYIDGSVLAHLGNPDMRVPISHALAWPQRIDSGVGALDLFKVSRLDFEEPDEMRFPCLAIARQVVQSGGAAPAVLNAANEVAVAAFLDCRIKFTQIPHLINDVLDHPITGSADTLEDVLAADGFGRSQAQVWLAANGGT